ncbi:MAG: hypothetical protein HY096_14020 [Nitrospinae bacterium]|nr:hypothetical protein [Nitrospinota bacterium]
MKVIIFLISFISFLGIKNGELATAGGEVKCEEIAQNKLLQMMEKEKGKVVVVDYRTPEDYYNKGHISDAILFSPKDKDFLQQRLDYLALQWKRNSKTAVIVDNDGREANIFCRNMKMSMKYEHIYSLKDGMRLWTLPLEKGKMPVPGTKEKIKEKGGKGK